MEQQKAYKELCRLLKLWSPDCRLPKKLFNQALRDIIKGNSPQMAIDDAFREWVEWRIKNGYNPSLKG